MSIAAPVNDDRGHDAGAFGIGVNSVPELLQDRRKQDLASSDLHTSGVCDELQATFSVLKVLRVRLDNCQAGPVKSR